MANTVNVSFDAGDFESKARSFADALLGQVNAVEQLAQSMAKYNANQDIVQATFKGLTQDGEKFQVTVKQVGDQLKVMNGTITQTAENLKALAKAQKEAAAEIKASQQEALANQGETIARGKVDPSKFVNDAQLNAYDAAIKRIKASLRDGSISLKEFQDLLEKVGAKPRGVFEGLTTGQEKLLPVLRDLTTNFEDVGAKGKGAGERILISWQGVVRLFESQILRQAIRGLINEFRTSITTAEEFSIKIAKLEAISGQGKEATAAWTKDLNKLSTSFGIPQVQVAEAAYQALQSGQYKAGDSTKVLEAAFTLSQATLLDVSESTKLLTTTMNVFGKTEQDVAQISNVLFKTIQGGNIDQKEFASGFTKLASDAKGSGVKLEELAAIIDTLTRKGATFQQAASTIEAVLRNITKPSKELQAEFAQLGAVSGQHFLEIQNGLGGVLKHFNEATTKGKDLGELTTKFTELQAVTKLTSIGLDEFNDSLDRFNDTTDKVKGAAKTVKESLGQDFQVELDKVNVFFTDEIGTKFASGLLVLGKALGGDEGLVGAIKRLITIIEIGVTGLVVYKGTIIATTLAQSIYSAVTVTAVTTTNAQIAAFVTGTAAAEAYTISLRGVALSLGVVAALGAAVYLLTESGKPKTETSAFSGGATAERERQSKAAETQAEMREKAGNDLRDQTNETKKAYDERFNALLGYSSKIVALSNDLKKKAVDNLRDTTEALKLSAKSYVDVLQKSISDIRANATEAKELIKHSLRVSQDLPRQGSDSIFKEKLKFASDGSEGGAYSRGFEGSQQDELLKKRIVELSDLARKKYAENTKESVEEARKLFGEVEKLTVELFDKGIEARKKKAQEEFNTFGFTRQPGVQVATDPDGSKRLEFTVQTAEFEKKINTLTKERIQLEESFRLAQAQRQKDQEAAALKEKARLETLQLYIKEAANFKVTDDKGKIQDKYKTDPALAGREFQEIVDKINKTAGPEAIQGQFQFFSDLYKQRLSIVKEVNVAIIAEGAATTTRLIENAKKLKEAETEALRTSVNEQFKIREDAERKVAAILQTVGEKGTSTGRAYEEPGTLKGEALRFKDPIGSTAEDLMVKRAEKARQAALAAIQVVAETKAAYDRDPTLDNAEKYAGKINVLTLAIKSYISARTGIDQKDPKFKETTFPGTSATDPNRQTVDQTLTELNNQAERIRSSAEKSNKAQADLLTLKKQAEEYDDALKQIPKTFGSIGDAADTSGKKLKAGFADQVSDIKSFVAELQRMEAALNAIKQSTPEIRGNRGQEEVGPPAPGSFYGGPRYMYDGGQAYWQPRGSDNMPAMLREGETVMTPQASREFYPILASMNGGGLRNPTATNQNGQVTNVGDIHVHVQGGDNAQSTIREIAKGLRREFKRGTAGIT